MKQVNIQLSDKQSAINQASKQPTNQPMNMFQGELTVGQTLDRETKASYRFEVVASDSPNNPDERKSERSDSITITIQVNQTVSLSLCR